jgi:enoyl-[acyl-carrier protein] reductase II
MLQTPICRDMGIEVPIFSVGFSWLGGPELVSAVSNAGGCGVLGAAGVGAEVRSRITRPRALRSG